MPKFIDVCGKGDTFASQNCMFFMKSINALKFVVLAFVCLHVGLAYSNEPEKPVAQHEAKKILFIGDSMTGWLSERLNAYGKENGFEVSTVVWDGSTMQKWGNSPKLKAIVKEQNPDAVFVSLGMNELFESHPETRLKASLCNILDAIGHRPLLWVGPPSWPGHDKGKIMNDWLEKELGSNRYFRSSSLKLPRQSAKNPHPTKPGMQQWMDAVVEWIPENSEVKLPGIEKPRDVQMARGKVFLYKRMGEIL